MDSRRKGTRIRTIPRMNARLQCQVHVCSNCKGEFTLLKRKVRIICVLLYHCLLMKPQHHCRRCGQVFCGNCVTKLPVYRMNYVDPAFVCKKCESTCTSEADFYEHHLKILCKGTNPHAKTRSCSTIINASIYRCQVYFIRFGRSRSSIQLLLESRSLVRNDISLQVL